MVDALQARWPRHWSTGHGGRCRAVTGWWRRLGPWGALAAGLVAGPLAGVVVNIWLPGWSAVVVAVAVGLAAMSSDWARREIARRAERRDALPAMAAGASERGRLRRVREWLDPLALGIH